MTWRSIISWSGPKKRKWTTFRLSLLSFFLFPHPQTNIREDAGTKEKSKRREREKGNRPAHTYYKSWTVRIAWTKLRCAHFLFPSENVLATRTMWASVTCCQLILWVISSLTRSGPAQSGWGFSRCFVFRSTRVLFLFVRSVNANTLRTLLGQLNLTYNNDWAVGQEEEKKNASIDMGQHSRSDQS